MRPRLSALQSGPSNQDFQNFADQVMARAFKLPSRDQYTARTALTTRAVGILGRERRSVTRSITWVDSLKIFSAYPSRHRKTVLLPSLLHPFPFQLGNFFDQLLHQVIVIDGLANALVPSSRDTNLARFTPLALN